MVVGCSCRVGEGSGIHTRAIKATMRRSNTVVSLSISLSLAPQMNDLEITEHDPLLLETFMLTKTNSLKIV